MTRTALVDRRHGDRDDPQAQCQRLEQEGGLEVVAPLGRANRLGRAARERPKARLGIRYARSADARGERGGEPNGRSEEHTSELQSLTNLVCRLLLEKKKTRRNPQQLDR